MANTPEFKYQAPFPLGPDDTEYYLLTKDYVSAVSYTHLTLPTILLV